MQATARTIEGGDTFPEWAATAAALLADDVDPDQIIWLDPRVGQQGLFPALSPCAGDDRLAARLIQTLKTDGPRIIAHASPERFDLLYRIAWRIHRGERQLLADPLDPDVRDMQTMLKQVRRDMHKMKAFVRFRRIEEPEGGERFVAWHRPDHRIVQLTAPFFARRFSVMRWTIFTPHESADWDGETLRFGEGVASADVDARDELESLWKTYYANIFNPGRIKINAMINEMPVRHWRTLPEASIINQLLRDAPARVRAMHAMQDDHVDAESFIPDDAISLPQLAAGADQCAGCDLHEMATQAVFGEGPADARLMLIGEQPGDVEDRIGRPFVGPAGQVLDEAFAAAGIDRRDVYLTNAVKHFKHELRGKRRLHKRPNTSEIRRCGPFLIREINMVDPDVILLLGATAGQALFGAGFRLNRSLGQWLTHDRYPTIGIRATYHPSMVLRAPDSARRAQEIFDIIQRDLTAARDRAA